MNKQNQLLWKIDGILAFIDLKVMLLLWILIDLYRNTVMLAGINGRQTMKVMSVLQYVWDTCGSPYLIWIPIVAIADIAVKRLIKGILE